MTNENHEGTAVLKTLAEEMNKANSEFHSPDEVENLPAKGVSDYKEILNLGILKYERLAEQVQRSALGEQGNEAFAACELFVQSIGWMRDSFDATAFNRSLYEKGLSAAEKAARAVRKT